MGVGGIQKPPPAPQHPLHTSSWTQLEVKLRGVGQRMGGGGAGPNFLAFWDRNGSGLEGDQRLSARWLLAQPWGEDLAWRGPTIVCGKTESNLKSILGWSQFCLWGGKYPPFGLVCGSN